MVLKILLIVSIALQLVAAVLAVGLTRRTKFNLSWILFTIALCVMSVMRLAEYTQEVGGQAWRLPQDFFVWLGVATSLCFAVGVLYVKKIFNWIARLDFQRRLTEKRILNMIVRTEEKERMRLAKELHDGLGPLLSSAKMSLSALKPEGKDAAIVENVNYVIEEAIRSLREISNNLSPHVLNDFGLARGIDNFISKSLALSDMQINFETNLQGERFDTDVEVILYRVAMELINNSVKHSHGHTIDIALTYADGRLRLDYRDDGRGFNPRAVSDIGMGLSNILSRIGSLKGTADITSAPGAGMRALIEVDLTRKPWRAAE